MRVVAVVVGYWPNRRGNVLKIVSDLAASTRPPDRIIVLSNNPELELPEHGYSGTVQIDVVRSTFNTWTRGKFVTALLDPADFYVLCDDDTSVGPRTIERFLAWAGPDTRLVSGYWGVRLVNGSFMSGKIIQPNHLPEPVRVDAFHGRIMFMGYDAVARTVAAEAAIRVRTGPSGVRWDHEGCDIIAGLSNAGFCWAIPLAGEEQFVDLAENGQALQYEPGYFASRDTLVADYLAIANRPLR